LAVISKIYDDLQVHSPPPHFVLVTGDYQFANTATAADAQLKAYATAMAAFDAGPVFAAMGHTECDGATEDSCPDGGTPEFDAYWNELVAPLGKTAPYYSFHVDAVDGTWTSKFVLLACNAWDSTQKAWAISELAEPTTYTFVVRHEPADATTSPCYTDTQTLLAPYPQAVLLEGHTHTYQHLGQEVVVGNAGSPLSGTVDYGYLTVEQQADGGLVVTAYDYSTQAVVDQFTYP
jgi:hypothetical protein